MIPARPFEQKAAFNRLVLHSLARSRLVARTVGSEAVIAIGHDSRHRQRLRPFTLQRLDLLVQRPLLRQVLRRHHAVDLIARNRSGANHLPRQQCLSRRAFPFRNRDRPLHVGRIFLVLLLRQPRPIRLLDLSNPLPQRRDLRIDLRRLLLIRLGLLLRRQRIIRLHVPEQRGLHLVIIFLRYRVELVIVAARAIHRQPQHPAPDRADHVVEILVPELRIVLLAITHLGIAAQKPGGDHAVVADLIQFITGNLFGKKAVVRSVLD